MNNKLSKRILAVALATSIVSAGFGASTVWAAYTAGNDTASHLASSAITNAECVTCHGNKALEKSLDTATFTGHKRHLYSAYLRFQSMGAGCAQCHVSTDIDQGSGASVNKQVDVELCRSCHGAFPASVHGGVDWAKLNPRGCAADACHKAGSAGDPAAAHAAVGYVNTYFASSRTYCTKCHGGLKFYAVEETN